MNRICLNLLAGGFGQMLSQPMKALLLLYLLQHHKFGDNAGLDVLGLLEAVTTQDDPLPKTLPAPLRRFNVDGLAITRRSPATDTCSGHHEETPAVVLVHGAMDRAASFGRVMRRLGDFDVCAYDRRGYAGSIDAAIAPTLDDQAEDLRRVCEWTGAARVVVIGHSFGGTVAMRLAESSPSWLAPQPTNSTTK